MAGLLKNKYVYASDKLDFSRSIFRYEKRHSTNLLAGMIVPVHHQFLYPGDSPDYNFGCVIESAPLISTNLDNIYVDVVSVWTPARLVMTDWNEFLGESHTQAFTINRNITIPKLTTIKTSTCIDPVSQNETNISKAFEADRFLAPHLGFRMFGTFQGLAQTNTWVDDAHSATGNFVLSAEDPFYKGVSVLPSRVYELNWNTFFRNENVQTPILIDKTSAVGSHDTTYTYGLGKLQKANRLSTWYTRATPAPSLLDVSLNLGDNLPVITGDAHSMPATGMRWLKTDGTLPSAGAYDVVAFSSGTDTQTLGLSGAGTSGNISIAPSNLWANMASLTVNRMYYALMEQRFANKMMKGRRAVEFYANFFGVQDSDADYDLPKLLVQKRYPLNVSQVIATGSTTNGTSAQDTVLGQRGAYSTTGFGDALIKDFTATEHGFLQTYLIIRGQPSIASGIDLELSYDDLLSTYLPEFDHIGPVGIPALTISNVLGSGALYFGYTNAWYAERNPVSDVVGIMSPDAPLGYKTLADLNQDNIVIGDLWLRYDPRMMDRIFMFPVCYASYGNGLEGEPFLSNRYQFLTQFVVKGKIAKVMSPDSEPLKLRL